MDKHLSPLSGADEAKLIIGKPHVVVVDARGGADALERFSRAHVKGAVFVNLETDLSNVPDNAADGGRHPLTGLAAFLRLLGSLGITPSSHVLVYDDKFGANAAARFWWMMRSVNHRSVQVIDGGLTALQDAGVAVAGGPPSRPAPTPDYPHPDNWQLPVVSINQIEEMRTSNDHLVIDVREGYRYRGESEPIDLIAGHIPGAVNVPYTDNLQADGRFRPAADLASMFHRVTGGKQPENIAVHCGSGVTACHTLLAMEVAGLPIPRLYVGSWSEWSRNGKPVATGPKP